MGNNKEDELERKTILMDKYISNLLGRLLLNHKGKICFLYDVRIRTGQDIINLCLSKGIKTVMKDLGVDENDV